MTHCAIALHLRIRVKPPNRDDLLKFLSEAKSFYERPGGIAMRLLQSTNDRNAFIEVFEYASVAAYEADERRVRDDPRMKAYLERWRNFLDGPPIVEVYAEQPVASAARGN